MQSGYYGGAPVFRYGWEGGVAMRTFFVALSIAGTALAQAPLAQTPAQQNPGQQNPGQQNPLQQTAPPSQSLGTKPQSPPGKQPPAASTPESRSAAELALSPHPVFDDGTYLRIRQTLLSYSDVEVRGGWPALPIDAKLAPGASGGAVALLRRYLAISGDLPANAEAGETYDEAVTAAVKKFQLRHGLEASGSVGPQTLKALNVPVKERIKQLEASLERLRGMDFIF